MPIGNVENAYSTIRKFQEIMIRLQQTIKEPLIVVENYLITALVEVKRLEKLSTHCVSIFRKTYFLFLQKKKIMPVFGRGFGFTMLII